MENRQAMRPTMRPTLHKKPRVNSEARKKFVPLQLEIIAERTFEEEIMVYPLAADGTLALRSTHTDASTAGCAG